MQCWRELALLVIWRTLTSMDPLRWSQTPLIILDYQTSKLCNILLLQMHNLLELIQKEQTIYNICFHELIRQVSVQCVERGELLANIRKRYSNLLDRIPRQVKRCVCVCVCHWAFVHVHTLHKTRERERERYILHLWIISYTQSSRWSCGSESTWQKTDVRAEKVQIKNHHTDRVSWL